MASPKKTRQSKKVNRSWSFTRGSNCKDWTGKYLFFGLVVAHGGATVFKLSLLFVIHPK